MELLLRAFPILATVVVGAAHAIAWRSASTLGSWGAFAIAFGALAALAVLLLRREEVLGESLRLVPGDVSRGIAGAVVAVLAVVGLGLLAVRAQPLRSFDELRALIFVATRVPLEWQRALGLVGLAACSELIFRGAVSVALEGRLGSTKAPLAASALYVLAAVPSLRPSVVTATLVIGAVTGLLTSRLRRITPAIVAHAAFAWLAVEFVLPSLWQRLLVAPR